jgi:hypothetical protein
MGCHVTRGETKLRQPPFDVNVPAPTPGSDEALKTAYDRLIRLTAWWDAPDNHPTNAESDAWANALRALDEFIAKTAAIGAEGIAVKFQRLCTQAHVETNLTWGTELRRTITEALKRLAKGSAA